MSEAALVKKIMARLEQEVGGVWIKISAGPFQVSGLPDIIGCCEGHFFGLEVKLPGKEKTLTKIQQYWIKRITDSGGTATMITSVEESIKIVKYKSSKYKK